MICDLKHSVASLKSVQDRTGSQCRLRRSCTALCGIFVDNVFTYLTTRYRARYKTKIRDVHELRERTVVFLWTNGISWISALENGERDFEFMWLQEDSLNIRREHFSLLTFCHMLFLKGRLCDCLLMVD